MSDHATPGYRFVGWTRRFLRAGKMSTWQAVAFGNDRAEVARKLAARPWEGDRESCVLPRGEDPHVVFQECERRRR